MKKQVHSNFSYTIIINVLLFVLIITSCKKQDSQTYNPVPPGLSPAVSPFGNYKPLMLTREESQTNKTISAYRHAKWGLGAQVPKPKQLKGAFGFIVDVLDLANMGYDLFHKAQQPDYQADFDTLNNELAAINTELQQLSNELDQLMAQLALTTVDIKTYLSSLAVQTYLTDLNTTYSTTLPSGLLYYSEMGEKIQNHQSTMTWVALNGMFANTFVKSITANNNIENDIQGVHDAICPDLASVEGCLKDYTDYLVLNPTTNGNNQQVHNPANIMSTYMLLENYFSTLMNHQLQGLTILANVYNYEDTTGSTVEMYIDYTFAPMIIDEINAYLKTVNYMALNLFDLRSVSQYTKDMGYRDYGLAPDSVFYNILARANFICNLYMVMINVEPSSITGNIVIPSKYTDGTMQPATTMPITLSSASGGSSETGNANALQSTWPYTYWEVTGGAWQASPDNYYNLFFYQFDTAFHPGSQKVSIALGNLSGNKFPWYYQLPPTGDLIARYYNPRNPSYATSTTQPTDSNTILFGFFASRWIWGYQMLSMGDAVDWSLVDMATDSRSWSCFEGSVFDVFNPWLTDTYADSFSNLGETWALTNQTPQTTFVHSINFKVAQSLPTGTVPPVACSAYEIGIILNPVTTGAVNFFSAISGTNPGIYNCGTSWNYVNFKNFISNNIFGFSNQTPYGFGSYPISASGVKSMSVTVGQAVSIMIDSEMAFTNITQKSATFDWNLQPMFTNTYNVFN